MDFPPQVSLGPCYGPIHTSWGDSLWVGAQCWALQGCVGGGSYRAPSAPRTGIPASHVVNCTILTPHANRTLSLPHLVAAESRTHRGCRGGLARSAVQRSPWAPCTPGTGTELPGRGEDVEEGSPPTPGGELARHSHFCPAISLPASPASPAAWLLLGRKSSLPTVGPLGLEGPSRWGGETALEVLGLGCSGELRANRISLSSSDSILMAFLGHSVWQDFLFWGGTVLQTSYAVGSQRARLAALRGAGG